MERAAWSALAAWLALTASGGTEHVREARVREEAARVRQVTDGDTLRVQLPSGRVASVRLIGVDAPEVAHRDRLSEYLGQEARAHTASLVAGRLVTLQAPADRPDKDDYGRLLRYVVLPDGRSLNAELIRQGFACSFNRFPHARQDEFQALEQAARRQERGLWADGGLAELSWNARQARKPLLLHPMTNRSWALQYGSYVKPHIRTEHLGRELNGLRRLLAQPDELGDELPAAGYRPWPDGDP